jgi:competence protein ComEC
VSFAMDTVTVRPTIGDKIRAKVYVSAPQGPVEPGGFDFRKHAYFLSLGAVGYGRSGFDIVQSTNPKGTEMFFARAQGWLSQLVQSALSEQTQGVARAIIAGDRFGVSQAQAEDLRRSNLAHLLAISGLHMGLLTSLVFFSVRFTLVIMPMRAIANHAKTIAAIFAITVGALYLGISGGNIATQRAFVMIAAFYSAAMLNRQVISYRALAMAAMVILIARPEALYSPGFQMSFAATIALVFVFQNVVAPRSSGRILHTIIGVFLSSFVAGVATAPIAAIHFNQISHVGFFANLLAVLVMSAVVACRIGMDRILGRRNRLTLDFRGGRLCVESVICRVLYGHASGMGFTKFDLWCFACGPLAWPRRHHRRMFCFNCGVFRVAFGRSGGHIDFAGRAVG